MLRGIASRCNFARFGSVTGSGLTTRGTGLVVPRQNVVRAKNREISRRVRLKMKRELNLESSPTPRCSLLATSERIAHAYINVKGEVRAWCFRAERLG